MVEETLCVMMVQPGRILVIILLMLVCWQFSGVGETGNPRLGPDANPVPAEDQLPVEAEIDEFAEAEHGEDEDLEKRFAWGGSLAAQTRYPAILRDPDGPMVRLPIVLSFLFRPPANA